MKCALVGCGYWGEKVLSAMCEPSAQESRDLGVLEPYGTRLLQRADFTLIGVYDGSLDNAQKARQAYPHLHIYPSYEALLADKQIEAIFLITPPASHFPLAKAALESKKHIFVEKPLALSSKECALLYELASKQGVVLHCDHIFLYAPAVQWLRAHIQEFGQIHSIHARRASLGRFQKEVSVVWDLALHDVAILAYVLGSSVLEKMKPCAKLIDVSGYLALADIGFSGAGEPHISIHTSWLSPKKVREMVIVGTRGVGVYDEVAESKLTLFSVDSVLGEQFDKIENFVKGTDRESANLPQNFQNLQSPTANPRILEEESRVSLRDTAPAVARQSTHNAQKSKKVDSSMDSKETSAIAERYPLFSKEATLCHADFQSARNDRKPRNLNDLAQDFRSFDNKAPNLSNSQAEANLDSSKSPSDSKIFNKNAQNVFCSQVDRRQDFCDKNGALQGESKARTWACVTAGSPPQSPFLAKKPTPKPSQAQFSSQAELPTTPPLISSIAHFYAQITQGQICPELAQHTIRVVQILEQIDAATLR